MSQVLAELQALNERHLTIEREAPYPEETGTNFTSSATKVEVSVGSAPVLVGVV